MNMTDRKTKPAPSPKAETSPSKAEPPAKSESKSKPEGKAKTETAKTDSTAKTETGAEKPAPEAKTVKADDAKDPAEGYSRGEGQKPVSRRYRNNWDQIFGKKR
ncbi:MAG: hypothetical protein HQ495_09990 [Alphaproteobacteria bacterium]|nr:hypothetical protein [Alphaproteobacteria bacterium]